MNADEVGALLFRIQDAYPHAAMRPGTLDEWKSSAVARFSPDIAFAAFDRYRDENDKPPGIATMVRYCQAVARERVADRMLPDPANSEPPCPPDEAKAHAAEARRLLNEARSKT